MLELVKGGVLARRDAEALVFEPQDDKFAGR
jgi:hypothetical protein